MIQLPPAIKIDERLVYERPDGVKFLLHAPPSRVVMSEEGFGTPPIDYVTDRSPFQQGYTVRDFHLGPRSVQLVVNFQACSRDEYWTMRNSLLDAIRPNRITNFSNPGKLLYYLPGNRRRQLDVVLESGPGFAPPQGGWHEWSFTEVLRFIAPDPAWYDPRQKSVVFDAFGATGAFVFPVTFPVTFATFGGEAQVTYLGTWVEYPTIVITGPIVNPIITNHTTGDVLEFNYTLNAGRSMTITLRNQKTVLLDDGTNLVNFLTSDSDLTTFSLVPEPQATDGINVISGSGTGTLASTTITILYYDRFIGI